MPRNSPRKKRKPRHLLHLDLESAGAHGIRNYPGYYGAFSRRTHRTALYPSGTRIKKVAEEDGDSTPLGTGGTVLGSIRDKRRPCCAYFIEWDDKPREAIFCIEWKLGPE